MGRFSLKKLTKRLFYSDGRLRIHRLWEGMRQESKAVSHLERLFMHDVG